MRCSLMMAVAASLFIAAAPPSRTPEAADVAALQGTWVLKTTEYLGEKADQEDEPIDPIFKRDHRLAEERELPEDVKKNRTILKFKGKTFEFRQWQAFFCGPWRERVAKMTYTLDVKRTPKVMGRIAHNGKAKAAPLYWTYQVNGDTLQIGIHFDNDPKKLPTKFTTDKDEDVAILTFRKEKK